MTPDEMTRLSALKSKKKILENIKSTIGISAKEKARLEKKITKLAREEATIVTGKKKFRRAAKRFFSDIRNNEYTTRSRKSSGGKDDGSVGDILGNQRVMYEFLVLLAIIVHAIDFFAFGFRITWGSFFTRMMGYFVLSVFAYWILKPDPAVGIREFFIVSAIPVFLIPLVDQLIKLTGVPSIFPEMLSSIFLAIPVWVIYLIYFKGLNYPFFRGFLGTLSNLFAPIAWAKTYFFLLFMAVIVSLLFQSSDLVSQNSNLETFGIDPGPAMTGLSDLFTTSYDRFSTGTMNFFGGIKPAYDQMYNDSLGSYHRGRVEENADKTGVFIDNFKASGKYYEGIPITFFPIYKVRSFDQEINMKVWCEAYDQRNKSNVVNATIDDSLDSLDLLMRLEDQQGITCEFNTRPENTLVAGRYKIRAYASFTFETWAFTNYVFMERNFVNSVRSSGEDVNKKFEIDKKPVTIYTSGPLMMGMNQNIDLPVSVDYERTTKIPVGITIDNKQKSRGDLLNVNKFEIRVPNVFKLNDKVCTRKVSGPVADKEAENYDIYTFKNPKKDVLQSFVTVDCSLQIDGADAQKLITNSGGITQASLVGTVEYNYLLRQEIFVNVLKNPLNQ